MIDDTKRKGVMKSTAAGPPYREERRNRDDRPVRSAVDAALGQVMERFPFANYIDPVSGGHLNIARTVLRYCPPGSRILDFGCGPCDKTAILQLLGYKCTGCDDLQDYWHRLPGYREAILSFASECGIEFVQAGKRVQLFGLRVLFERLGLDAVSSSLFSVTREALGLL